MKILSALTMNLLSLIAGAGGGSQTPPPDQCVTQARILRGPNELNQYRVLISLPSSCPLGQERLARIITKNGGKLPPLGYYRLGGYNHRYVLMNVFPGFKVQDRPTPNVWNDVPIVGAWWQK